MRNLIVYIVKHHYFLLFFLLEVFAIWMIVSSNHFQRAGFVSTANEISGRIYKMYSNITEYFNLKQTNELLSRENAVLRSLFFSSYVDNEVPKYYIIDPRYSQKYSYIPAKVVNNTTNRQKNYLTLDKGRKHGVAPDMGVIGPEGVVGVVIDVSDNFSSVISVLNVDLKISAKEKKTGYVGSLEWDGVNKNRGILKDISTYIPIQIGDSIVTSGYSSIFPEGILIGTISEFDTIPGENFYRIKVKYVNDFNRLSTVYIVRNLLHYEQKQLEERTQK